MRLLNKENICLFPSNVNFKVGIRVRFKIRVSFRVGVRFRVRVRVNNSVRIVMVFRVRVCFIYIYINTF